MARTRTRKTRGELLCEVLAEGPVDKALKMAPMAEHAGFGADKVRAMSRAGKRSSRVAAVYAAIPLVEFPVGWFYPLLTSDDQLIRRAAVYALKVREMRTADVAS